MRSRFGCALRIRSGLHWCYDVQMNLFFVLLMSFSQAEPDLTTTIQKKYPNHKVVAQCPGAFMNRKDDMAVAISAKKTDKVQVLWISQGGKIQELDSVPSAGDGNKFELDCMSSAKASSFRKSAESSEGIHSFLKFPKGNGLLCYFTGDTDAKCWTFDKAKGVLVDAGGWQT